MTQLLTFFKLDLWTLVGLAAQVLFFIRYVVQWYLSEKAGKVVIPRIFWTFSQYGSLLLLLYAMARRDLVFFLAALVSMALYTRNLVLEDQSKAIDDVAKKPRSRWQVLIDQAEAAAFSVLKRIRPEKK